jgi:hypothetical protein
MVKQTINSQPLNLIEYKLGLAMQYTEGKKGCMEDRDIMLYSLKYRESTSQEPMYGDENPFKVRLVGLEDLPKATLNEADNESA